MKRGQGALEYLIIIAAVLAIAAIVVLFLTGAFGGAKGAGDVNACKQAASACSVEMTTSVLTDCSATSLCDPCAGLETSTPPVAAVASTCTDVTTYDLDGDGTVEVMDLCNMGAADCIVAA